MTTGDAGSLDALAIELLAAAPADEVIDHTTSADQH